jgi:hypothetical protein
MRVKENRKFEDKEEIAKINIKNFSDLIAELKIY